MSRLRSGAGHRSGCTEFRIVWLCEHAVGSENQLGEGFLEENDYAEKMSFRQAAAGTEGVPEFAPENRRGHTWDCTTSLFTAS